MDERGCVNLEHNTSEKRGWQACVWAALPLVVTLVVFWQGTLPASASAPSVNDKVAHFIVFGLLAASCVPFVAYVSSGRQLSLLVRILWCSAYSTLIGGALEVWQATLSYRTAEWLDFVADVCGALVASGLVWLIVPRARRKEAKQ